MHVPPQGYLWCLGIVWYCGTGSAGVFRFWTETQMRPEPQNPKTLKTLIYFGQLWLYSDMLGMKMHVLQLGDSMVASDKSFEPSQN